MIDPASHSDRAEGPGLLVEENPATGAAAADLIRGENACGVEVRAAVERQGVQLDCRTLMGLIRKYFVLAGIRDPTILPGGYRYCAPRARRSLNTSARGRAP